MKCIKRSTTLLALLLGLSACAADAVGMRHWNETIRPAYRYETLRFHGSGEAIWVEARNFQVGTDANHATDTVTSIIRDHPRLHGLNVSAMDPKAKDRQSLAARIIVISAPAPTIRAENACVTGNNVKKTDNNNSTDTFLVIYCKRQEEMSSIRASLPVGTNVNSDIFRKMLNYSLLRILPSKNPVLRGNCTPPIRSNC